jgi:SAM-dependent methyltransferase
VSGHPERRRLAESFDGCADEYARHRPTYPDELVDAACATAGLRPGDRVLEIGCGAGQLTGALLARGLQVDAVDHAPNMLRVARQALGPAPRLHLGRFEELALPAETFAAVFSASAFHWLDPRVSWARAADVLRPGGTLALLQFCGVQDERFAAADEAMMRALERAAPEIAAEWPRPRTAAELAAGVEARRANVSEVWAFISHYDLADPLAARRFGDARLATHVVAREQTADELIALFGTTSLAARLGPEGGRALAEETRRAIDALGGRAGWAEAGVLVTARRR